MGEAAAGLLVAPRTGARWVRSSRIPAWAQVSSRAETAAEGDARHRRGADRGDARGAGRVRRAFSDMPSSWRDLNGEHFKFKEAALASMRLDRLPPEGGSAGRAAMSSTGTSSRRSARSAPPCFPPPRLGIRGRSLAAFCRRAALLAHAGEDDGLRVALVARDARSMSVFANGREVSGKATPNKTIAAFPTSACRPPRPRRGRSRCPIRSPRWPRTRPTARAR